MFDYMVAPDGSSFQLSSSFVHKRFFSAAKTFLQTGSPFAAGGSFVSGGGAGTFGSTAVSVTPCGPGWVGKTFFDFAPDAQGKCVPVQSSARQSSSIVAPPTEFVIEDFLPTGGGGMTGTGVEGTAVVGSFGMAAMVPMMVGQVMDHHGQMNPIRRCPPGSVLGKDNLCYMKIPNSFRKWPRAPRPPVSASDAKCIRRAASATKRVQRLAKSVGLKMKR